MRHRAGFWFGLVTLVLALAGCGGDPLDEGLLDLLERPETAVDYEVVLNGAPSEEIAELAEASLELYRRQDDGAASAAFLRARAEDDIATMQKILRSRGYYSAEVTVEVTELPAPEDAGDGASARAQAS